jgi:regulator of RNase E activity RraB
MSGFYIPVPDKSEDAVRDAIAAALHFLQEDAAEPIVNQRRYIDHLFSALDERELVSLRELFTYEKTRPGEIERDSFRDELGVEHDLYALKVEDSVLVNVEFLTGRILNLIHAVQKHDVEYEGWWIYYRSISRDG